MSPTRRPRPWRGPMRLALLASSLLHGADAIHQGSLQLEVDGALLDLEVVALSEKGQLFEPLGREITLRWGDQVRGFVAKKPMDDMPIENYFNVSLFHKEISYNVDLSAVGCSCNAALFFVTMPGYGEDGSVAQGDFNPFYCDGNKVGGVWCWEHDSIEANRFAMATTAHACSGPPGQYIAGCDESGCRTNSDLRALCPDARCKIDSRRPFRLFQQYIADPAMTRLVRIRNRLVQGSNEYEFEVCNEDYLERMTVAFKREMVMVFQLWGDQWDRMAWLDADTGCIGGCAKEGASVTFGDIQIRSLSPGGENEIFL